MNLKKFTNYISKLSTVKRFSQATMAAPESVLEHSAACSLIALFIGEGLAAEGVVVDFAALLKKAILHDFDEIATGDVARPVKYHSAEMRALFKELESQNMMSICDDFAGDCTTIFFNNWQNAKGGFEGAIIALSDFICVLYKIHNEIVLRGNRTMLYYFQDTYLQFSSKLIYDLNCKRSNSYDPSYFLVDLEDSLTKIINEIRGVQ
jgi:5'-deoxynucleotidase YfbR-like HD superfamily hydrolase